MRRFLILIIIGVLSLMLLSLSNTTEVTAEGEVVVIRGDEVPLSARLLQNGTYGDPVPNQIIVFYDALLDAYLGSALTNQEGYASIIWNMPSNHPLGLTPVNATFTGNETLSLAPSCQWAFVHVLSRTQIVIENYTETLHPEDHFVLEISLLNDIDEPIIGAQVYLLSATSQLASAITNETGYAFFALECNLTWSSLGVNDLWVRFEQNLASHHSQSELLLEYTVEQVESIIDMESTVPTNVNLTDSLNLQFCLETYEGGIPDSPLIVLLNNIFFDSVVTNQYGEATLIVPIDSRFSLGPNTFQINYNGTDRNAAAHTEISFNVKSPVHLSVEVPERVILGIENVFKIEVTDILGRYIPNSVVHIHDLLSDIDVFVTVPSGLIHVDTVLTFYNLAGLRTLEVAITGSNYITNTTHHADFIVWSQPTLVLSANSILGYASPSQDIAFEIQLINHNGAIPERLLELKDFQNETIEVLTTDLEGNAEIRLTAPAIEGTFSFTILYSGTQSGFELPASYSYQLIVTKVMPVSIQVDSYEINPPAQEILVSFIVRGLNGTYLKGVDFIYTWNSFTIRTISQENGFVSIHLPILGFGTHILYYQTEAESTIASCYGNLTIIISEADALAAQGVGIPGLTLSVLLSMTIVGIPVIYRRSIIG